MNAILTQMKAQGKGLILACTEINLLVGQEDNSAPLFDGTRLQTKAATTAAPLP